MAKLFNDFEENRARVGAGSGIYIYDSTLAKYKLIAPSIEVPFISSSTDTVEVRVVTSDAVTKLGGTTTYDDAEAPIYMHRDVIKILESLKGATHKLLFLSGDFSGQKCDCEIQYSPDNATQNDAWQGTVTFIPKSVPQVVYNAYNELIPTAHFKGEIPTVVYAKANEKLVVPVEFKYSGTTITATCDETSITASVGSDGASVEITGTTASKSGLVTVKTNLTGYASWETTILVIVE